MKTSSVPRENGAARDRWTLGEAGDLLEAADDTLRPGGLELTEYALGYCDFPDGSRILDAGCGTAATARHLIKAGRLSAVGVDRSPTLLAEARRLCPQLPLVLAELEQLPFADGSFDGVVCECVLSQTDAAGVLTGFGRILRPGGYLILSDLYRKTERGAAEGSTANPGRTGETTTMGRTPGVAEASVMGCPGGIGESSAAEMLATKQETVDLLENAGFETVLWEDRTADLKRLALRLIMAPGSSSGNLNGWCRQISCSKEPAETAWWRGVGYHLIVAGKYRT